MMIYLAMVVSEPQPGYTRSLVSTIHAVYHCVGVRASALLFENLAA